MVDAILDRAIGNQENSNLNREPTSFLKKPIFKPPLPQVYRATPEEISGITRKIIDRVRDDRIVTFDTVCGIGRASTPWSTDLAEELDLHQLIAGTSRAGRRSIHQIRRTKSWDEPRIGVVIAYGPKTPEQVFPFIDRLERSWEMEIPQIVAIDDTGENKLFQAAKERGINYRCLVTSRKQFTRLS